MNKFSFTIISSFIIFFFVFNHCAAQGNFNSSISLRSITKKSNLIKPTEVSLKSDLNKILISIGLGISKYDKSSALYSLESIAFATENFSFGLGLDFYRILIDNSSSIKARAFNVFALYYHTLFSKNPKFANFFLGGGLTFIKGVAFIGILRLDFNLNKNLSIGSEYKQPVFFGTDFSAPPLMLFNITVSYKFKF